MMGRIQYNTNLLKMVTWMRWYCLPDTGFEIGALAVLGSQSRRLHAILNLYQWAGKKHFDYLKLEDQSGARTRDLRHSKQAAITTAPGPPPYSVGILGHGAIEYLLRWICFYHASFTVYNAYSFSYASDSSSLPLMTSLCHGCYVVTVAYLLVVTLYILSPPPLMPSLCYVYSSVIRVQRAGKWAVCE